MSAFARCLVVEADAVSDPSLDAISKSLSETLILCSRRVSDKSMLTHLMVFLVTDRVIPISPLQDICSTTFVEQFLPKISSLGRFRQGHERGIASNGVAITGQHMASHMMAMMSQIHEETRRLKDMKMTFDMTYVSGRPLEVVTEDLIHCFVKEGVDYSFFSQINLLSLHSSNNCSEPSICGPAAVNKYPQDFQVLFESQVILDNEFSIDAYFKVWLHELNIASERVRIQLDAHSNVVGKSVVIKCDLKEAVIDVNRVPIGQFGQRVNNIPIQSFAAINGVNHCYDFKALQVISREGLSDSLLFGIPYILSATHSPDILYDELKLNSSRFKGLCEVLNEKNGVILLESMVNSRQMRCPRSYFVVFASPDSKTLMMKAIASKELILPQMNDSIDEMLRTVDNKEVTDSIRKSVNGLPFSRIFNPLSVKSNLFEFL